MENNYLYAKEKLIEVVRELAINKENIKERLCCAYGKFRILREDDFPEDFKKDLKWIDKHLIKVRYQIVFMENGDQRVKKLQKRHCI